MTAQGSVRTTRDEQLLVYLFEGSPSALAGVCEQWITASRRFRAFVESNREKIRKKVRIARDEESRKDLQAELATAYQLVQEPRLSIAYEAYAAGKQRGPDFTVVFRVRTRFNVEVTRLREGCARDTNPPAKLAAAICAKLGQMPPSTLNLLVLAASGPPYMAEDLSQAIKLLKARVEAGDAGFFQRTGFVDRRDFYKYFLRLSGILLSSIEAQRQDSAPELWRNPEARHQLSAEIGAVVQRHTYGSLR